jgi:hypothetical protein
MPPTWAILIPRSVVIAETKDRAVELLCDQYVKHPNSQPYLDRIKVQIAEWMSEHEIAEGVVATC